MNPSKRIAISTLTFAVSVLTASQASAQNPGFELGNLFLGFQASGAGSDKYVLANVGDSALTFRDASPTANLINMFNVNSALVAQFGQTWFDRSDLFVGAGASFNNDEFTGAPERNGDAFNTIYITSPRESRGIEGLPQSNPYSLSANAIQQASNGLYTTGLVFEQQGASNIATITSNPNPGFTGSFVDYNDQNPVAGSAQGAAYNGVFAAGVQDVFGPGTFGEFGGIIAEAALDLYRVDPATGTSSFEGTMILDNAGNLSFIVTPIPEPSSAVLLAFSAGVLGFVRRRSAARA